MWTNRLLRDHRWFDWLELDAKWLPQLTKSLQEIEIDGKLQSMNWDEQVTHLRPSWIEKATKFCPFDTPPFTFYSLAFTPALTLLLISIL
jgi:hypothetical protein